MIELFCPVFCDEPTVAAELNSPKIAGTISNDARENSVQVSMTGCEHQSSGDHKQTTCNDECLCHAMAIASFNQITHKDSVSAGERIVFRYGDPVFNSLPPPFQPPKNS